MSLTGLLINCAVVCATADITYRALNVKDWHPLCIKYSSFLEMTSLRKLIPKFLHLTFPISGVTLSRNIHDTCPPTIKSDVRAAQAHYRWRPGARLSARWAFFIRRPPHSCLWRVPRPLSMRTFPSQPSHSPTSP